MRRSAHPTHPPNNQGVPDRAAMNPVLRHDERSYRGHGPLLPPRPCSSERAVPAMGDRHGLWYPEQGRTPERPGLRSHAGG